MRPSDYAHFKAALTKAAPRVVSSGMTVVSGNCAFLVERGCRRLAQAATNSPSQTLFATELSPQEILRLPEQQELFAAHQVYVIKDVAKRKDLISLVKGLNKITHFGAHLILAAYSPNARAGKSGPLAKLERAEFIPCKSLNYSGLSDLSRDLLREYKLGLARDAEKILLEAVGSDPSTLENEISKLSLIFHDTKSISAQDLAPHLSSLREDVSFILRQHLMDAKFSKAQILLTDLLNRGESPLAITGLLAKHCRNSLHIGEYFSQGVRGGELARKVGIPPFQVDGYLRYARSSPKGMFERGLQACADADRTFKSRRMSEHLLVDRILTTLVPALSSSY